MDQITSDNIERSHLAILLYKPDILYPVRNIISKNIYFNPVHADIYSAIKSLRDRNITPELSLILREINGNANSALIISNIIGIDVYGLSEPEAIEYTNILFNTYVKRYLDASCSTFIQSKSFDSVDLAEKLSKNIDNVLSVFHDSENDILTTDIVSNVMIKLNNGGMTAQHTDGMSWGLTELNNKSRIQKKYVHVVGARPGAGKTSLIKCIIKANSILSNKKGLFVSLEITAEDMIIDMLALLAKVNNQNVRSGNLSHDQLLRVTEASKKINNNLIIDDRSGRTSESIISQMRMLKKSNNIDYVMIDFLQKMTFNIPKGGTLDQAISKSCKDIADAAKELDVAVIELSQLSREVEKRIPPRPKMSDLKDSGDIESMAKMIVMLWRPAYYGIHRDKDGNYIGNLAEFMCVKNRYGSTGDSYAKFIPEYTDFEDYSNDTGISTGNEPTF